jgi:nitroreductase
METHTARAGRSIQTACRTFHRFFTLKRLQILGLFLLSIMPGGADELKPISLPNPGSNGGRSFMESIRLRRTTREFSPKPLPPSILGGALWAGFGINRPEDGRRTAPSAMNSQEVDLYVALPEALYLYQAKEHRLHPVLAGDFRGRTGQTFATNAPAVVIFVADFTRLSKARPEMRQFYAGIDTGAISQNLYLYCAAHDLATVVYDLNRDPLAKAMELKPDQHIILAQALGYPKTKPEPGAKEGTH